jgi:hypothetical protein
MASSESAITNTDAKLCGQNGVWFKAIYIASVLVVKILLLALLAFFSGRKVYLVANISMGSRSQR